MHAMRETHFDHLSALKAKNRLQIAFGCRFEIYLNLDGIWIVQPVYEPVRTALTASFLNFRTRFEAWEADAARRRIIRTQRRARA